MSKPTTTAARALLDVAAMQDDPSSPLYSLAQERLRYVDSEYVVLAAQILLQPLVTGLAERSHSDRANVIQQLREHVDEFEAFESE